MDLFGKLYTPRSTVEVYDVDKMLLSSIGQLLVDLLNDQYANVYGEYEYISNQLEVELESPERDLFIWAILFNRKEVAMLFWRAGQDPIGLWP